MAAATKSAALAHFQRGDLEAALTAFVELVQQGTRDANIHYLAGQCLRRLGRAEEALPYFEESTALAPKQPEYWHGLGIARQLVGDFEGAIRSLRSALEHRPNYVLAINSLAMTQKKMGALDKALENYEVAANVHTLELVRGLENKYTTRLFRSAATRGTRWVEHATEAAIVVAVEHGMKSVAWLSAKDAKAEEKAQKHGGLFWTTHEPSGRLYLPNFFNALRDALMAQPMYANLVGNRGTVLKLLGRGEEADEHFAEAREFSP